MSQAADFLKKAASDEALAGQIKNAIANAANKDDEVKAVVEVARKAGFDVDVKELAAAVFGVLNKSGKISDEDLDKVAGGLNGIPMHPGDYFSPFSWQNLLVVTTVTAADGISEGKNFTDIMKDVTNEIQNGGKKVVDTISSIFSGW